MNLRQFTTQAGFKLYARDLEEAEEIARTQLAFPMLHTKTHERPTAARQQQGNNENLIKQGRLEERARCEAILLSEHAQGKTQLAYHLALHTDMPVGAAIGVLQAASVRQRAFSLSRAMELNGTPGVSSRTYGSAESETPYQQARAFFNGQTGSVPMNAVEVE